MSRTIRYKSRVGRDQHMFRKPRHRRALIAKHDEYGIRKKAIPPTNYEDINIAANDEDYWIWGDVYVPEEDLPIHEQTWYYCEPPQYKTKRKASYDKWFFNNNHFNRRKDLRKLKLKPVFDQMVEDIA